MALPSESSYRVIDISRHNAPRPLNPFSVKGAGEAGISAVGAAIAAAVDDALGRAGAARHLPITPNRLHALLAEFPAARR